MSENWCELCARNGVKSKLRNFSLNFDEGMLLCENTTCVYPFGAAVTDKLLVSKSVSSAEQQKKQVETKKTKQKTPINNKLLSVNELPSYIYWNNADSLCWLDSVLAILVNNKCLRLSLTKLQNNSSILQRLCDQFDKAQDDNNAELLLTNVRSSIFNYLKPKMKCELGCDDNPMLAMQLLLQNDQNICEKFTTEYVWKFKCTFCNYKQMDRFKKQIISFPNTGTDFTMSSPCFLRPCYKCNSPNQRCTLEIQQSPPCLVVHFLKGVKNKDIFKQPFQSHGKEYQLYQLIQYKQNPDHFTSWIRNGSFWTEVDDMNSLKCEWKEGVPKIPSTEFHLGVYERCSLHRTKRTHMRNSVQNHHDMKQKNLIRNKVVDSNKQSGNLPTKIKEPVIAQRTTLSETRKQVDHKVDVAKDTFIGKRDRPLFEPYVPRKKRNVCDDPKVVKERRETSNNQTFSTWHDTVSAEMMAKRKGLSIDNQSDSGYSSPASNSSTLSVTSGKEQSSLEEFIDSLNSLDLPESTPISGDVDTLLGEIFSNNDFNLASDMPYASTSKPPSSKVWEKGNDILDDICTS